MTDPYAAKAREIPQDWITERGEQVAIEHGFTAEQYRAAKHIEFMIFGPYEWQDQGDRAASMMVQICEAIREAVAAENERCARVAEEMYPDALMAANIATAIREGKP